MPDKVGVKVTANEFDNLSTPMAKDMEALFKVMYDEILNEFIQGYEEGLTPDELINKIENLI